MKKKTYIISTTYIDKDKKRYNPGDIILLTEEEASLRRFKNIITLSAKHK